MSSKVMREIDHLETDEYGYQVIVLVCGHRFTAHQTSGTPTAKTHRRVQWCTECSQQAKEQPAGGGGRRE